MLALLLARPIRNASADAFAIPRSPHLAASTNEAPDESRCDLDEDGNGLDDEMELRIARAAAPELRFDRNENAREPDEPYTLFNIRRSPRRPGVLSIRYALLYKRDGGAVYSLLCSTAHSGDSESLTVDVKITEGFSGWVGEVVGINGRTSFLRSGTHPVVFLSAGKKHQYYVPGLHRFGANCPDGADGDGARVTPGTSVVRRVGENIVTTPHSSLFHAPLFFSSGRKGAARDEARKWKSNAPLFDDRSGWWNACLVGLHPTDRSRWRPATRHLTSNDLGSVFPGEAIEGPCFRGGLGGDCTVADPVWVVMSDKLTDATDGDSPRVGGVLDADGDGQPEVSGLLSLSGSQFALRATDACPDDPRDPLDSRALDSCEPSSVLRRLARVRTPSIAYGPTTTSGLFPGFASTTPDLRPFPGVPTGPRLRIDTRADDDVAPRMHAVALGDIAERMGVTPTDGLVVPISRRSIEATNSLLGAVAGAQSHEPREPDLLWVGRGARFARWIRLRPSSIENGTVLYDGLESGTIDATLSPSAQLLADKNGEGAAVVDPKSNSLLWFDSLLRVWVRSAASLDAVRDRVGATFTLRGLRVFAVGGRAFGASVHDGWAFDAFGEAGVHLPEFPPTDARMQLWSAQGALLDGQFRTD